MSKKFTIERWEWVPVKFAYEVEAESAKEAVEKLTTMDADTLSPEEVKRIMKTRSMGEVNSSAEFADAFDEVDFWSIDGTMYQNLSNEDEAA